MHEEIKRINWDIIGFAETKEKVSKIVSMDEEGFKLFMSGNDVARSNGVGFLVNRSLAPLVDDYGSDTNFSLVYTNIDILRIAMPTFERFYK